VLESVAFVVTDQAVLQQAEVLVRIMEEWIIGCTNENKNFITMKSKKTILYAFLTSILLVSLIYSCDKDDNSGLNSNNSNASNNGTINNGSSGTNCPTTSACGCSAFNKSDCESHTDCCKWTVGQGCGCK
jgi:hypothetical protein